MLFCYNLIVDEKMWGATMTIGEKIKGIRRGLGLSQENLAHDLGCGIATISRIERGLADCSPEMLAAIKATLGIEGAPFTDAEKTTFRQRFYVWGELLGDRRMDDARDLGQELSVILKLPFEQDLVMLYRLYEISQMLSHGQNDDASRKLDKLVDQQDQMSGEHMYRYLRNRAGLDYGKDNHQALKFNLQALEFQSHSLVNPASLYYNIAGCYFMLNHPVQSLIYLEKAGRLHNPTQLDVLGVFIDHVFAGNYLKMGELNLAKERLDRALIKAEAIGRKLGRKKYIGMILHLLGVYHQKLNDHAEALNHFNRAAQYFWEGGSDHLDNLCSQIRCLITLKRQAEAKDLLKNATEHAKNSEIHAVIFGALEYALTLRNPQSVQHLEGHAIPYLIQKNEFFHALDFCHDLECYHKKQGNAKKSLETAAIVRDIYAKIFFVNGTFI